MINYSRTENKENIWIINQHIDSPLIDGDGHRHHYIAEKLFDFGYHIKLITCSYTHVPKKNVRVNKLLTRLKGRKYELIIIKTNIYKVAHGLGRVYSMFVFTFKLLSLLFIKTEKPDIIVVSSLSLPPILSGIVLSKFFRSKLIFEVRDIWPLTIVELGGVSRFHPLVVFLSIIEKLGYKYADHVVSVLPKAIDHINKVVTNKFVSFTHVSNGISLQEKDVRTTLNMKVRKEIVVKKFKIGYAGNLGVANNMKLLIDVARLVHSNNQYHFYIVGDGDELEMLKDRAEGLGNISFLGRIPKVEVSEFLKLMDVLFISWKNLPIYRFGVSANKLFDYLYAEKPIVVSGNVAEDPVAIAKAGIIVKGGIKEDIRDALELLKSLSNEQRDEMGLRGKLYVKNHCTYEVLARKYASIFNSLR